MIGTNNLAAALSLGAMGQRDRRTRITAVTGLFEFAIPLVGIWLGQRFSGMLADHARWFGSALLATLGCWAIWSASRSSRTRQDFGARVTTWKGLFILALGLSLDNLVIGFSLGLSGAAPLLIAVTIAIFSMTFTWIGVSIGNAATRHHELWATRLAGCLLLLVALANWTGWI